MFMNFTTHPYHITEFKLRRVRDPSTDTVTGPVTAAK